MANPCSENLFLLEFLVEDLQMNPRCDCVNPGELCVSYQFLDNEPLDLCEGDFNQKFKDSECNKTGKSCLFSLTPIQAQTVQNSFDITVNVCKRMPPGWQPDKTCIGTAVISILPLYIDLMCNPTKGASARVLQEKYNLLDGKGCNVGKIKTYIRLSCYGKNIVTQFQMNMKDKSVLFKDKEGNSLYRYKKSKKGKPTNIQDMAGKCNPLQTPPCLLPQNYEQNQIYQPNFPPNELSMFPQMQPNLNCPMQPCCGKSQRPSTRY